MKDSEKNPDTSGVHLWLILLKSFHSIAAYVEPRLRASGLGSSDFRVLEVLLHKGPMAVNTIGPKVMLTPGSISTAVERLHERGLVARLDCAKDRRRRIVELTPKGRKLISCVFSSHAAHIEALMETLTPSERTHLLQILKKLGKRAAEVA